MNLLARFNEILNPNLTGMAQITGQKDEHTFIAQTLGGSVVVLTGSAKLGDKVFYNKATMMITGVAPNGQMGEFGV